MRVLGLASTRKRTNEGHQPALEEGALRGQGHAGPGPLQAPRSCACREAGTPLDTWSRSVPPSHRPSLEHARASRAPPGAAAFSRLPGRLHAGSPRPGEDEAIACLQACERFRRHG
jgi:hypothetical protein